MSLSHHLHTLESASLVRLAQARPELEYLFRHALVQDAAYGSLVRLDRVQLHRAVGETLERLYAGRLDELAALLGRHFDLAEQPLKALGYLTRAAEQARRTAAHREEADLLSRAIAIAIETDQRGVLADLHSQRGKALNALTLFAEAQREFEQALAATPPDRPDRRAAALLDLAATSEWLWDTAAATRYARAALELADQIERADLSASAMCSLAYAEVSEGRPQAGLEMYDRAFARARNMELPPHLLLQGIEFSGLTLYWVGRSQTAIERSRDAIQRARKLHDSATVVRGMANLALALSAEGRYAEALSVFDEALQYGRTYEVRAWLARAVAMLGGLHLDLSDYARAETLAEEAREMARSANFAPPIVSGGIDLIFMCVRSGQVGRAERLIAEVAERLPTVYGSHRWIWENRFVQARAELALAREEWADALSIAAEAMARSRATGRIKYEALGLQSRAEALAALGRRAEAAADLRQALSLARRYGNPALLLRVAGRLLALEGDDDLLAEMRATAERIMTNLPDADMRRRFARADAALAVSPAANISTQDRLR